MTGITTHKIFLISILETIIFLATNSSPEKKQKESKLWKRSYSIKRIEKQNISEAALKKWRTFIKTVHSSILHEISLFAVS